MSEKCALCGGAQERMYMTTAAHGYDPHGVADCLLVLNARIAALEVRHEELVVLLPPPDEEMDIKGRGHVLIYNSFVASGVRVNQRIRVEGKEYLVTGVEGGLTLMGTLRARHGVGLIVVDRSKHVQTEDG